MKKTCLILAISIVGSTTAAANESMVILKSAFEDAEGCVVLNGLKAQIPIETISVSGALSLNGADFPATDFDDGTFYLRDRETGAEFVMGDSRDSSYDVTILPGRYDVVFSKENSVEFSPLNTGAVVRQDVWLYKDQVLDIDVIAYMIGGDVTLGGGPFSQTDFDDGTIYLVSELGGQVVLADTRDQSFADVPVIAGTYDIYYEVETRGSTTPGNRWARIGQMTVDASSNDKDIDVPVFNLIGEFTLNGAPFVASDFDDGNFYLENDDGDRVLLGSSKDQSYSINVVPGAYDIYWEVETPGGTVPINARARLGSVSVGDAKLSIDVTSHVLSGDYSVNGIAFPASELNQGRMLLRDKNSGEFTELGRTKDQSYQRNVAAGVYDVLYQHLDGSEVPQNKGYVVTSEAVIDQDQVLDLDVPSGTFSVSIFQNGVLFPADANQAGTVILQDPDSGDVAILGSTSVQQYSVHVAPGTYDAYYGWIKGDQVPLDRNTLIAEGVVVSPPLFLQTKNGGEDLHVTSYVYPGSYLLNGGPPPGVAFDNGEVFLRLGQNEVRLGETRDQGFSARMIYDPTRSEFAVHYEVLNQAGLVPSNEDTVIGCVKLKTPVL